MPEKVQAFDIGKNEGSGQNIELQKSYPNQLSLFRTYLPDDLHKDDYSNTIELYDAIPKFFASKKRMSELREGGKFLDSLHFDFFHKGKEYTVRIDPARLIEKDGTTREYYPSPREELLEQALRKIACDQLNAVYLDENAGVQFTLHEVRKELERRNHSIRYDDLIKSLKIGRRANIILTPKGHPKQIIADSGLFSFLSLTNLREWREDPKHTCCYVQFHPLVTMSINRLTYRQFDYAKFMTLKEALSRWIFKRLSHNYIQASWDAPYTIKLSRIVEDSRLVNDKTIRHRMRRVNAALEDLIKCDRDENNRDWGEPVLSHYEVNTVIEGKRGKIVDAVYTLYPHGWFIRKVKNANKRQSVLLNAAVETGTISQREYERQAHLRRIK